MKGVALLLRVTLTKCLPTFYNNSIKVIRLVVYLSNNFIYFENKEKGFNVLQKMLQRYLLIIEFEHGKFFLQVEFSQIRSLFFSAIQVHRKKRGLSQKRKKCMLQKITASYLFEERIIEIQFLVD